LDAVYYYYRSLWVRNTFLSAHDNLVGLFDETSRKAQEDESIKNATANPTNKRKVNNRSEVWLIPGHKPVTEYDEIYHLESPEVGWLVGGGVTQRSMIVFCFYSYKENCSMCFCYCIVNCLLKLGKLLPFFNPLFFFQYRPI
jgi:hypothetical protein